MDKDNRKQKIIEDTSVSIRTDLEALHQQYRRSQDRLAISLSTAERSQTAGTFAA